MPNYRHVGKTLSRAIFFLDNGLSLWFDVPMTQYITRYVCKLCGDMLPMTSDKSGNECTTTKCLVDCWVVRLIDDIVSAREFAFEKE